MVMDPIIPEATPLTAEQIAAVKLDEDTSLAEYVGSARNQLMEIVTRNQRDIVAWQDSISQLEARISAATTELEKAQKSVNAIDRIGPAVLPPLPTQAKVTDGS